MDFLISIGKVFATQLAAALPYVFYSLPLFIIFFTWKTWIDYVQEHYIKNIDWVLLEIKIPKEITKPPEAMELFLIVLNQSKEGTFIERWFKGFVPAWFSLEVASFSGDVHFYIRTPRDYKKIIEDNIYSQYSEIEIVEKTEDYADNTDYFDRPEKWGIWAGEYKLTKDDYYPIKTYLDYNLKGSSEKSDSNVDPLTPFLETFGSLLPGEQMWSQILVRTSLKRFRKPGSWFKKVDWKYAAKKELDKLQKRDKVIKEGEFPNPGEFTQTPQEKFAAEAISRSLTKTGFDCGWRVAYLAPVETFNKGNIAALIGSTKHFNSAELNGFAPKKKVGFEYPWQDMTGKRTKRIKWELLDSYRKRSYFYAPYTRPLFVLTTEELATIYRFPGSVAATPTLGRIESKRSDPPANLPV